MFVAAPFQGVANTIAYPQVVPISFVPVMVPNNMAMGGGADMHAKCMPNNTGGGRLPHPSSREGAFGNDPKMGNRNGLTSKKPKGRAAAKNPQPKKCQVISLSKEVPAANDYQPAGDDEGAGKGVISLLQEFVQCSKNFPTPQHRPILQWKYDTQMADFSNLEFRAQVAFLLDGVPHHVAGAWHPSKKLAQRDAAERCMSFFIGCWGAYLIEHGDDKHPVSISSADDASTVLDKFCQSFPPCRGEPPRWSCDSDGRSCRAFADINLLGVRHMFAGGEKATVEAAKQDAAKRVLWYLQCPGFEDEFEPDLNSTAMTDKELPAAPETWVSAEENSTASHAAERKTALMNMQNRLQQTFRRQMKPGQSVWEWSYETDANDAAWPPLCRATVDLPAAAKSFTGPWERGQREAQLKTCNLITAFLDAESTSRPSSPSSQDSTQASSEEERQM
eukprot:gb/GFBE01083430.1/.p1 GENE.gb/GFBE01083430.1/~~gb/GFBE01083430.1/.p1  ORF type:complete len:447 (+),score=99.37 gb/GFBE01083430.1/:1-1341(+)